ncbi:hypothetical protein BU14_2002s0001 [Porphyra umbilicalis]|uniref:Uncharacterized protein n=1 Tax=Porphyra umbilicalis TaxID=2786 RepID=A0A1X6NKU9_PORUM|nr:hypothetical protein BU14_2002s0001 [Porphyra umbilicalis]|eukprot:OSX68983.1 hypothetical protein BU14_2002s0001 [Porphyra umbilicalis]
MLPSTALPARPPWRLPFLHARAGGDWEVGVVGRLEARLADEQRRAPHAAEPDVRVVGFAALGEPLEPRVAPPAAGTEAGWQPVTPGNRVAPAVALVAIKVGPPVLWVLPCAAGWEGATPGARHLQVKAVVARHVVANVGHLNDVALVDERRRRAAIPILVDVHLVGEDELVALPTVAVARQPVRAPHGGGGKAHRRGGTHLKGDARLARTGGAPAVRVTHGPLVGPRIGAVGAARAGGARRRALVGPRAGDLAAIPVVGRPRAGRPLPRGAGPGGNVGGRQEEGHHKKQGGGDAHRGAGDGRWRHGECGRGSAGCRDGGARGVRAVDEPLGR